MTDLRILAGLALFTRSLAALHYNPYKSAGDVKELTAIAGERRPSTPGVDRDAAVTATLTCDGRAPIDLSAIGATSCQNLEQVFELAQAPVAWNITASNPSERGFPTSNR
jgi:hypothetical protein